MIATPVLARRPRAAAAALVLVLAGCATVAGTAACGGQANSAAALRPFDAARAWRLLEEQVAIGPRHAGSPGAEATRALIERELRAAGLEPVREAFLAQTPAGPIEMCNVWAEVPAREPGAPRVVLGSHFDTKRLGASFVGANDGGSSTAVLLELARALAAAPSQRVTWRLVFFDGEEALRDFWADPDNRYGSRHHVARLKADGRLSTVKACVVIDMVGDRDLLLTRDEYSGRELQRIFREAARSIGLGRHMEGASMPVKDDHQSFLDVGIESIDLIDFEYGPDNAWWHTDEDTLEKCSQQSLDAIGRIVLAGLPALEAWVLAR
jgi:glutaminyl-peptide cyclotransferase